MSTIRLTLNKNTEQVITLLEERYKPLTRAEILKLALAKLNRDGFDPNCEVLNFKQSKRLDQAIQELDNDNAVSYDSVGKLIENLED